MTTKQRRVLVTGARGAIGRATSKELQSRGHFVRGFGRNAMGDVDEVHVGNLADADAVRRAVAGMDTVVHLAATPDDADFMGDLLPNNVIGSYNVFDACREEGVERLVVASTVQVVSGIRRGGDMSLIRIEDGTAVRNHYGVTKIFGEAMAEMYAHRHGISMIVVRLGWLPREPHHTRSISQSAASQAIYLSPTDAGLFHACCVEAGELPPVVTVFATSRSNGPTVLDLEPARKWLGFEPMETWPQGCPHPIPED